MVQRGRQLSRNWTHLLPQLGKLLHLFTLFSTNCLTDLHSILCSDFAIKRIDEPFISRSDNVHEWDV